MNRQPCFRLFHSIDNLYILIKGEPAVESSSAQAVNIQQQQETAIGQEMAPITVTTETQSAPIEISDF